MFALNERAVSESTENLKEPRRQQQRERNETKGLMNRKIAVPLCYNSWYINLLSSALQRRKTVQFEERGRWRIFIWN